MNKAGPQQDAWIHASALLIAVAATLFAGWLLFSLPPPPPAAEPMDVVLIEPVASQPTTEEFIEIPPAAATRPATSSRLAPTPPRSTASAPAIVPPAAQRSNDASPAPLARPRLYTADGRVAIGVSPEFDPMRAPEGRAPGDPDDPRLAAAKRRFERSVPIQPQDSMFAKDWKTGGNLAEGLMESAGKRLQKIVDKLPGKKQIQSAQARPPPAVRFNPALHERPSDLGSEATGDAYKAAPIAQEPVPGLDGEASRRIRWAIGEVEADHPGCDRARLRKLLTPALVHLSELEKVERAMASGVDPIRAEHLLPRSADMAYNQARRAIWYAKQQLATCAA